MKKSSLEPGFLQVFRLYAWLRLVLLILIPIAGLSMQFGSGFPPFHPEFSSLSEMIIPMLVMAMNVLIVLGFLYWSWFIRQLGGFYAPFILVFSTIGLMVEQHLFSQSQVFTPISPFLYILLILTAWQYNFKYVVLFTFGTLLFEGGFLALLPNQPIVISQFPHSERVVYFSLFARSIVFLLLGNIVSRLVTAQREQRQALANANQKLIRYAATQEQLATSRERVRLSRELHDTLAHTLSALAVQFDAILTVWEDIPEMAQKIINQMLETTRNGLEETRRTLSALRANPLEEMGFILALRTLVEDFSLRNSLSLQFEAPEDLEDFPSEFEHVFYRIAQETFENISRHANANQLIVKIEQTQKVVSMSITDDGCGFDTDSAISNNHLGLKGIRERAELIGADLKIESQPEAGTRVYVKLKRQI